jgi:hypothetical protein
MMMRDLEAVICSQHLRQYLWRMLMVCRFKHALALAALAMPSLAMAQQSTWTKCRQWQLECARQLGCTPSQFIDNAVAMPAC